MNLRSSWIRTRTPVWGRGYKVGDVEDGADGTLAEGRGDRPLPSPHTIHIYRGLIHACLSSPPELTIRRVVVGVLLMVLLLPGFDIEYGLWGRYEGVDRGGLLMMHNVAVAAGGDGNGTGVFDVALQVEGAVSDAVLCL